MAKQSSFIKLNRSILDWRWYKDANTFRVFIHILLSANFADGFFEKETVLRGEFATSLDKIASDLNLSKQNVRTAISHLKSTGELTCRNCGKYQVITIVNYTLYQGMLTRSLTRNQHATNTQLTPIEEEQEYNNNIYNNTNVLFPQSDASHLPALPLIDGTKYVLTVSEVDRYKELYPGIDVESQIRSMVGWLEANPKNGKTRNGIKRFINGWLTKEQNRAPRILNKDAKGVISDSAKKAGFDIDLEDIFEKPTANHAVM